MRIEFRETARLAFHLMPDETGSTCYAGFSYTIPKEEQVRSRLYNELLSERDVCCAVELEWNLYSTNSGSKVRAAGEIDIVRFRGAPPIVDLVEVKRLWNIAGWNNKRRELLSGIENDATKLRGARKVLDDAGKDVGFAGVFVASFADTPTGHVAVPPSWSVAELDAEDAHLPFGASNRGRGLYARFLFVRA